MSGNEGGKRTRFLSRNDKFLLGVYITMAITCTGLFSVTLVFLIKLEDSAITDPATGALQSISELSRALEELRNETDRYHDEAKQTSAKLEENMVRYQDEAKQASAKLEQNLTACLSAAEVDRANYEDKLKNLEYKLESSVERERNRLVADGFQSLSNSLLFKFFNIPVSYDNAKTRCRNLGTTLPVESIRNETLRSELHTKISYYIWIGLEESIELEAWVWSDGKIFEYGDASSENFTYTADEFTYATVLDSFSKSADDTFYKINKTKEYRYVCEGYF